MKCTIIIAALLAITQAAPLKESRGTAIANRYMVLLKQGTTAASFKDKFDTLARLQGAFTSELTIDYMFDIFPGFSATANKPALSVLLAAPDVELVEQESFVTTYGIQEKPPSWGLSRISEVDRDTDSNYKYNDAAGEGVTVYIVDTGVNPYHEDLKGRVLEGANCAGLSNVKNDMNTGDFRGHGTHVAGIVAGKTFGVAKKANIVPVKVLNSDGRGAPGCMVGGLDWILKNAVPGKSIVNISVGSDKMELINLAVKKLVDANIPVIVAAGNFGLSACDYSPSSAPSAYAVGSITKEDKVDTSSNTGSCVRIFAPGAGILSAETDCEGWPACESSTNVATDASQVRTGTSMAAPHVAGVAALYLSVESFPTAQSLYDKLTSSATMNKITGDLNGAPNKLLYSGGI